MRLVWTTWTQAGLRQAPRCGWRRRPAPARRPQRAGRLPGGPVLPRGEDDDGAGEHAARRIRRGGPARRVADEHEREHEVDADPGRDAAHVAVHLDRDDQQRAHQPEDRTRSAQGQADGVREPHDGGAAGQPGEEVDRQVAEPADRQLELRAEHPQHQHVEADVPDRDVGERRGEQLPVVALRDRGHRVDEATDRRRRSERELLDQLAGAPPGRQDRDPDGDVDRDQHLRGERRVARASAAVRRPAGTGRARTLLHALRALEADRRRPHAVGADRPVAALAADVRLALRVPVADRRLLRGLVRRRLGWSAVSACRSPRTR